MAAFECVPVSGAERAWRVPGVVPCGKDSQGQIKAAKPSAYPKNTSAFHVRAKPRRPFLLPWSVTTGVGIGTPETASYNDWSKIVLREPLDQVRHMARFRLSTRKVVAISASASICGPAEDTEVESRWLTRHSRTGAGWDQGASRTGAQRTS